jgi:pyruvate dehydrogenase E1 component
VGLGLGSLFARDRSGALLRAFAHTVDGQFQTFSANDGAYNRDRFFGQNAELAALAAHLSNDDIDRLRRGGHDVRKLHAAYDKASKHRGQPTVILAKTMKGFGMGSIGQGRMTTHQQKKLDIEQLKAFRDRFRLPLSDDDVEQLKFYKPDENSAVMQYLHARRAALGGYLPRRRTAASHAPAVPAMSSWGRFALDTNDKEMSTTMAFVRMLGNLLKDAELGPRVVPVADEARTFGMANLFRQIGIYSRSVNCTSRKTWVRCSITVRIRAARFWKRASPRRARCRLDRGGDVIQRARSDDAAVLHLLLDVRFPAHRRPDLGGRRPARARFPDRRTAGKTTLAARVCSIRTARATLRPRRYRTAVRYDPAFAYEVAMIIDDGMQEHDRASARRLLLHDGDERNYAATFVD